MTTLATSSRHSIALPLPRLPITVRPATLGDVPFMDSLQKLHSKQVGWMPRRQLEGKIRAGHVIVAETLNAEREPLKTDQMGDGAPSAAFSVQRSPCSVSPVGYCIARDQYFKRDDVGIIYQMNLAPGHQRSLIGATLLKAQFERSAYGCKLYCCWCAQDIAANRFWEAMGFVPLAFRAGSAAKARTHIFWQRRIRAGDETTPYWFPSQTSAGSIREDRLVFPIPPGTHWSDAKPVILPAGESSKAQASNHKQLQNPKSKIQNKNPVVKPKPAPLSGGLWFTPPSPPPQSPAVIEKPAGACPERSRGEKKPKPKNDPRLVAAARELRDRYLEEYNSGRFALASEARYDIARAQLAEPAHAMPLQIESRAA